MTFDALIFDVDGTLAETEELHRLAFNRSFAALGTDRRWPDREAGWQWSKARYRQLLTTTGGKERIAFYLRHLGIDPDPEGKAIAGIHAEKNRLYAEMLAAGGLTLRDGISQLICDAGRQGIKLAIATTTSRANLDALCRACFAQDSEAIFQVVAAGDDVAAKKPAPDIYRLALSRLGFAARHCVAFEDSCNGVAAAKAAGLRCVAAPSAYCDDDDLAAADLVLPCFTEIRSLAMLARRLGEPDAEAPHAR
jgi:HAD superfamily hydrolase (TIGR01509 family)